MSDDDRDLDIDSDEEGFGGSGGGAGGQDKRAHHNALVGDSSSLFSQADETFDLYGICRSERGETTSRTASPG